MPRVEIDDFGDVMTELERDVAASITDATAEGTELLKQDLRSDTADHLSPRLAKSWRSRVYPAGQSSMDPAGWVWTKVPKLVDAFDRGVTIKSAQGLWLAIPTAAAGAKGYTRDSVGRAYGARPKMERVTPGGFERRTGLKLRFVFKSRRVSLLVVDGARYDSRGRAAQLKARGRNARLYREGGKTIVVFILVPQAKLKKRLDVDGAAARAEARMPALLTKHWR
ncbi:hypothetical protein J2X45_003398 [Caulobacter sp. BE264]|uniref:DUF6441 family protein n=1 Tax=Caulobacter sp. BE264 TaxID=2817724 RepID=UPI0028620709|nr:DUF6441 family protein [Caulobacter sp. BE264]MDR7232292.1 hypothetical protein [Caulobacter sp. BE264]